MVTRNADGSPQVTMTWVETAEGYLLINTADGRKKVENMRRDPHVVVSVQDPDQPQQYLLVYGRAERIDEEGADRHIDELARQYLKADRYPWQEPETTRLIVRIAPERITGQGPWGRQQPDHVRDA